jgi:hypothetical protein
MIEGYKYTKEQLHLLIHNCNVYGLGNDIKEKYIKMLNELDQNNSKDE